MKPLRYIFLALVFLIIADKLFVAFWHPTVVIRSFYNWSTYFGAGYEVEDSSAHYLTRHRVERVYVKLIDVGWNPEMGITPNSKTQLAHSLDTAFEYVPVAFIENDVFSHVDSVTIDQLAINVMRHLVIIENNSRKKPTELQIDCDWNQTTRANYFQFLRRMKVLKPEYVLSATIRLYQAKYPGKSGVPPVDKGMLMVYNISDASKLSEKNSIFDKDMADEYVTSATYPLPLDVAIPAFSWALFYRQNKLLGVRNNVSVASCDTVSFLKRIGRGDLFVVQKDTNWEGSLLRYGDIVRPENCYDDVLNQAAKIGAKFSNRDTLHVAIFDLDFYDLKNISHESIDKAYDKFR